MIRKTVLFTVCGLLATTLACQRGPTDQAAEPVRGVTKKPESANSAPGQPDANTTSREADIVYTKFLDIYKSDPEKMANFDKIIEKNEPSEFTAGLVRVVISKVDLAKGENSFTVQSLLKEFGKKKLRQIEPIDNPQWNKGTAAIDTVTVLIPDSLSITSKNGSPIGMSLSLLPMTAQRKKRDDRKMDNSTIKTSFKETKVAASIATLTADDLKSPMGLIANKLLSLKKLTKAGTVVITAHEKFEDKLNYVAKFIENGIEIYVITVLTKVPTATAATPTDKSPLGIVEPALSEDLPAVE